MFDPILLSITIIGFIYGCYRAYKFFQTNVLYRNIRDCQGIYNGLKEKIKFCSRYNELSAIEQELWNWYYDYKLKVPESLLSNYKRVLLTDMHRRMELLKPRAFSYS